MRAELTAIQRRIYRYIIECIEADGHQPTIRQIADRFNLKSPTAVCCHLRPLARKGYIAREFNTAGVRLLRVRFRAVPRDGPADGLGAPALHAAGQSGQSPSSPAEAHPCEQSRCASQP